MFHVTTSGSGTVKWQQVCKLYILHSLYTIFNFDCLTQELAVHKAVFLVLFVRCHSGILEAGTDIDERALVRRAKAKISFRDCRYEKKNIKRLIATVSLGKADEPSRTTRTYGVFLFVCEVPSAGVPSRVARFGLFDAKKQIWSFF